MNYNNKWFSIIEIIVWIFIFSLWLSAIYLIIVSSLNLNEYNKNQIIASNLAREWVELVQNLRDSNYKNLHNWDSLNPNLEWNYNDENNLMQSGSYYKVELDPQALFPAFSVKIEKIQDFWEWKAFLSSKMQDYELCIDENYKYTYNCSGQNKRSWFYRYVKFEELKYIDEDWNEQIVANSFKLISKVIWYKRWYHEINFSTILADYKKL